MLHRHRTVSNQINETGPRHVAQDNCDTIDYAITKILEKAHNIGKTMFLNFL